MLELLRRSGIVVNGLVLQSVVSWLKDLDITPEKRQELKKAVRGHGRMRLEA